MSCKCQSCGIAYNIDFNVPNEIWEQMRNDANLLCPSCIGRKMEILFGASPRAFEVIDLSNKEQIIEILSNVLRG